MAEPRGGGGEGEHLKVGELAREKQKRGGSCLLLSKAPWASITPYTFDNCCVQTCSVRCVTQQQRRCGGCLRQPRKMLRSRWIPRFGGGVLLFRRLRAPAHLLKTVRGVALRDLQHFTKAKPALV
ncbi:uncharacterized protein LOC106008823 isoform X3 [Heterocephalus glaber]|nr:uncharacterized protein LOC106008823 isoform X3 [Heterocephalus glaber]